MFKIIEIESAANETLKNNAELFQGLLYFPLECQPYGLPNEIVWHYAVEDKSAGTFQALTGGIVSPDYGRTKGFFQCLGGSGVLEKDTLKNFLSEQSQKMIDGLPDAEITIHGETWREIVNALPPGYFDWAKDEVIIKTTVIKIEEPKPAKVKKSRKTNR